MTNIEHFNKKGMLIVCLTQYVCYPAIYCIIRVHLTIAEHSKTNVGDTLLDMESDTDSESDSKPDKYIVLYGNFPLYMDLDQFTAVAASVKIAVFSPLTNINCHALQVTCQT